MFQHLVDGIELPAVVLGVQRGRTFVVEAWNHSIEQLLGRGAEQAIGQPARAMLPPVDRRERRRREQALLLDGQLTHDSAVFDAKGREVAVHATTVRLVGQGEPKFLTVLQDLFLPEIATVAQRSPLHATVGVSSNGGGLVLGYPPMTAPAETAEVTSGAVIADNMRRRRRELGFLTQDALAHKIGKKRQQVVAWEGGQRPEDANLRAIARGLEVSFAYMLTPHGDER